MWEKLKENGPMFLLWTLAMTVLLCSTALLWKRAGTPEKADYHTTTYTDKSQWQAMMVLPNGEFPFQIDQFVYDAGDTNLKVEETQADAILNFLKGRCLFWIISPEPYTNANKRQVVQCFTKRAELKKFEKDK